MQIQINSDKRIVTDAAATASFKADIERLLARFAQEITRVEVHLSDLNGPKPGVVDKRCLLEVRPKGKNPISVTHVAKQVEPAVRGASQKMQRLLETTFGKKSAAAKREAISPPMSPASNVTFAKVKQIEALLAEVLEESPKARTHVRTARAAVEKIYKEPASTKKVAKTTGTAKKKAGEPKKMPIFQMRRKAQPSRKGR